jgi:hypothetical protein
MGLAREGVASRGFDKDRDPPTLAESSTGETVSSSPGIGSVRPPMVDIYETVLYGSEIGALVTFYHEVLGLPLIEADLELTRDRLGCRVLLDLRPRPGRELGRIRSRRALGIARRLDALVRRGARSFQAAARPFPVMAPTSTGARPATCTGMNLRHSSLRRPAAPAGKPAPILLTTANQPEAGVRSCEAVSAAGFGCGSRLWSRSRFP